MSTTPINKILVVGHPDSGVSDFGILLTSLGVMPALPPPKETRCLEALLDAMCRSMSAPDARIPENEDEFRQIQPGNAWQRFADDFIVGNANQAACYWIAPNHLPLLEFWLGLDAGVFVVMAYAGPELALCRDCENDPAGNQPDSLRHRLNNWTAYNSAMLRFHLRHSERSLLIHAGRERDATLRLLRERIGSVSAMNATPLGLPAQANVAPGVSEIFLVSHILANDPAAATLYEELQAASLQPSDISVYAPSAEDALADLLARRAARQALERKDGEASVAREIFVRQLIEVQESLEVNYLETQGYKWRLREAERLLAAPHGAAERVKQQLAYRIGSTIVTGLRTPSGVLFMPLVLVIETLHHLVSRGGNGDTLPPLRDYADHAAAERVKRQLSYRIGRIVVRNIKSPVGWVRMPRAIFGEIADFRKTQAPEREQAPTT